MSQTTAGQQARWSAARSSWKRGVFELVEHHSGLEGLELGDVALDVAGERAQERQVGQHDSLDARPLDLHDDVGAVGEDGVVDLGQRAGRRGLVVK